MQDAKPARAQRPSPLHLDPISGYNLLANLSHGADQLRSLQEHLLI